MEISAEAMLPVSPETAFDTFTDFAAYPLFLSGVDAVEMITAPPVRLKSRFFETRTMFGHRERVKLMVVEIDAPYHILLETRAVGTRFTLGIDLAAVGSGTRAVLTITATPETFKGRIALAFMSGMRGRIAEALATDLADGRAEAIRRSREPGGSGRIADGSRAPQGGSLR